MLNYEPIVYVCVYVCMCVSVCVRECVYVCEYVYNVRRTACDVHIKIANV